MVGGGLSLAEALQQADLTFAALSAGGNKSKKTETSTPTTAAKAAAFTYGTGACPKVDGSSPKTLKFSTAPKRCIDPAKTYTATFDENGYSGP